MTSTVIEEDAAFERAQAKYEISDNRLNFNWFLVTASSEISIKVLQKQLPELLFQAEQQNLVSPIPVVLMPNYNFLVGDQPQTSLVECGILMMSSLLASNGIKGKVYIKPPSRGGAIGPDMVTTAVESVLQYQDNLAKLATANEGERAELFVWLGNSRASMALTTPRLFPNLESSFPTRGPVLPPEVSRVWVATGPSDVDVLARALWKAEGGNWEVLVPPPRLA